MPYSNNSDLLAAMDERQVIELADDAGLGYSTLAELEQVAANPAAPQQQAAVMVLARIDSARASGDELINTWLRTTMPVPLDPVPDVIRDISVDMNIYKLYERRFRTNMPDGIVHQFKQNTQTLTEFRKGFRAATEQPNFATGQIRINKTKSDRLFGPHFG